MSKIIAGTAFVLLSGATVTGGVLLGQRGGKTDNLDNATETPLDYDLTKTSSEINKEGCVKTLFGEIASPGASSGSIQDTDVNSQSPTFLGASTTGCLVVNWDKKTKTADSKWSGNIRFLWAVKGESKGFVVYLLGKTNKNGGSGRIDWSGMGYLVTSSTTNNKTTWSFGKKTAEMTNKHFPSNPSDESKFPQPSEHLSIPSNPKFWNFFSEVADLKKIEDESQLTEGAQDTSMKGYWKWQSGTGENTKKLTDWTKDITKWWPDIFDAATNQAQTAVEQQTGTWEQKHYTPPASTTGTPSQ